MLPFPSLPPLAAAFFKPLADLMPGLPHQRSTPALTDAAWLLLGVFRVLENEPSGRAFLQKAASSPLPVPGHSSFFEALSSHRRLIFCQGANEDLARSLPDPFEAFPALKEFDLHAAAVHDPRDPKSGVKYATGHVYLMDLRSQALRRLDLCDQTERLKEHDLRLIKRNGADALRAGAAVGRKVIITWDRASIDFRWWQKAKDQKGLYMIKRPKSNTQLTHCGFHKYDRMDPVNAGVIQDELGAPASTGRIIRRITWRDPLDGEEWQFLTNEMTLEPGLIVLLYRRRWDLEKVYDEFTNKFHEKKSWAGSAAAKFAQAGFLCLTHNLTVINDHALAKAGVVNTAEIKRRQKRLDGQTAKAFKAGRIMPRIITGFQRLTQRSVKFIRWLRAKSLVATPSGGVMGDPDQALPDLLTGNMDTVVLKATIGTVIAYFISPLDLVPEALLGPAAYLDDLGLAAFALNSLLNKIPIEILRQHWAGDKDILLILRHILTSAHEMTGRTIWNHLKNRYTSTKTEPHHP